MNMATDKQLRFFVALTDQLGLDADQVAVESFAKLSVQEASAKLDELLAQREGQRAMKSGST